MQRIISRAAVPFVFAVVLASFCSAAEPPTLPAGWRGTAYAHLVARLKPRNPDNMKFIFLGDPIPCSLAGGRSGSGYGGFVYMKKHTFLWAHDNATYFYLLNADGSIRSLIPINNLEESSIVPRMVNVKMENAQVWISGETRREYVMNGDGDYEWTDVAISSGHYETELRKNVYLILAPGVQERWDAFVRANFKMLPLCQ